ncbi:MAG: hypothetical protein ABSA76_11540 [Bacteroidales bacterium]
MKKKKSINLDGLNVIELLCVKADWERTFVAEIYREKTLEGKSIVRGNVVINEGKAWSIGSTEEELGKYLDEICTMKLDHNLHASAGVTTQIFGDEFFLN